MVELIVALSITSIIMLGMSAFFSTTLHNMFQAQEDVTGAQKYSMANQILNEKLGDIEGLLEDDANHIIYQNKTDDGQMPFSYIGKSGGKIVFKDFFVFKGMIGANPSSNYADFENPGGIAKVGSNYYITAPLENKIYFCDPGCDALSLTWLSDESLNHPTDVTTNTAEDTLYVTDSGNDRIVVIDIVSGNTVPIAINPAPSFPVGIDFYYDGTSNYLFFSEPYENVVRRVAIGGGSSKIVVGDGDNELCDNSALYCKLNFPTGVYADDDEHTLYIADTGNNRILKMSDPGHPSNPSINFSSPSSEEEIKEIKFTFPTNTDTSSTSTSSVTGIDPYGSFDVAVSEEATYELWTQLSEGTNDTNECIADTGDPLYTCTNWAKVKIKVDNISLFNAGDYNLIDLNDATNPVTITSVIGGGGIFSTSGFSTGHAASTEVLLMSPVFADADITFNFSGLDTDTVATGFQEVIIEMYDKGDALLETRSHFLRIGDGELGTSEDIIEVLAGSPDYPTGVYWTTSLQVNEEAINEFNESGIDFDYSSDFELDDLIFDKVGVGDSILEITIDPEDEEAYILNAAIN